MSDRGRLERIERVVSSMANFEDLADPHYLWPPHEPQPTIPAGEGVSAATMRLINELVQMDRTISPA